jgi:hypothetical protein
MLGIMTLNRMTRVSLALIVAIGGALLLGAGSSDAAPLALGKGAVVQSDVQDSDVILVRDGCGRGMRWSHRRQGCVEDFGGGPPPAVMVRPDCRPGWRWSNSRGTCVPAGGGVDPAAAIIGGVIGGAIQATRPRGCGPGMRWSERRRGCVPL